MRRLPILFIALALLALPTAAHAAFGFKNVEVQISGKDGNPELQAGAHPFAFTTTLALNTVEVQGGKELPEGALEDLGIVSPEGLVADPTAVPSCPTVTFIEIITATNFCPNATAVGVAEVSISPIPHEPEAPYNFTSAVFNLPPPPGKVARLGFAVENAPVIIDIGITDEAPYRGQVSLTGISQIVQFFGSRVSVWGHPSDPAHDPERGKCASSAEECPVEELKRPFLTSPRSCSGPLDTRFLGIAWNSGAQATATALTSPGMGGCAKLGFAPSLDAEPTNHSAAGPSGFDFDLNVEDEGLTNPKGLAASDIKKAVVTLPEGVTANPSVAEGLATCSPADLERETLSSNPGEGCPQAAKVGTVEVQTPVLQGTILKGEIFVASQNDNPFNSLLAFYTVIRERQRGILVKQAAKVEPDPQTGQLVATIDDIPQFPLGHVAIHFREGGRSPLITPPACGTYTTEALFTPWADPAATISSPSSFQITAGVGGGPCPPAGTPPFEPGFQAGTLNPAAAAYSPLHMRLTRRDGDQDLTRFSTSLPPGLTAKLATTTKCPDAAIAAAEARSGRAELAAPSCPASSQIGQVKAGAGVGSELTYVPGKIYLSGPYNGAPLSVVAIVPAVAGPFDVGTVATRLALQIDPKSAAAEVDGSRSDPIPHILEGIPLKVRDIRAYVDRPEFTLNPTNCNPLAIGARIWGGGADLFSASDDSPVSRSAPFQAADCAGLGFKPRLTLRLKGGTKRGAHPALRAVVTPRFKDANFERAVVTLPRSAFLDQAHIRTICTRVQFAADACPAASIYGFATATTPILDEPARGPVYLRSSDHNLPDLVMALHGPPSAPVDVELVGRIDSHKGGIRTTFEAIPDLPVTNFVLEMRGGKRGLIVNSRNLCARPSRAIARFRGQNGRRHDFKPVVRAAGCGGKRGGRR
jgi:hypothetical protein